MQTFILAAFIGFTLATPVAKPLVARATCPDPAGPFVLQASGGNGLYATIPPKNNYFAFRETDASDGLQFHLDSNGHLIDNKANQKVAAEQPCTGDGCKVPVKAASLTAKFPLVCSIDSTSCALDCTVHGTSNNYLCYGYEWYISKKPISGGECSVFQPTAVSPAT